MDKTDAYIKEYLSGVTNEKVPTALLNRVKKFKLQGPGPLCPHCGKPITSFKKPLAGQRLWNIAWASSAALSFLLSFLFHRYFFQFVALTVLFGVKWIVDQRATKTQILIYKALQEEAAPSSRLEKYEEEIKNRDAGI